MRGSSQRGSLEQMRSGVSLLSMMDQTLIAAITLEGAIGAPMSVEGATDTQAFEAYVEHFLAPTLEKG